MLKLALRGFFRARLLAAAFAAGLAAAGLGPWLAQVEAQPAASSARETPVRSIDEFFRDFTAEWVRNDPDLARRTRYFQGEEQDRLERQLTPRTSEYRRARIARARRGLAELQSFDRASLSETQRVSADVMQWQLQMIVEGEPFLDHEFPLEQFGGANVGLVNTLAVVHPVATARDGENYVAALGQVAARMGEATAEARRLAEKGFLPPRFILRSTISQMQGFIASAPADNPLVAGFAQKMMAVAELPETRREELRQAAERIVETQIYPAWREAIAELEAQLPRASDEAGLSRLENGRAAYAYFLRRYTTTEMTPDAIHELGLQQVAALERRMDEILRRLGRSEGTLRERMEQLDRDLAYSDPETEEARAEIMRDIEIMLRDAERRAALLFDIRPMTPVIAQPYPRFREANAAASYTSPPLDGSRPGIFQFPRRPERMTRLGLRSLVYHETIPGHHFDIALQIENRNLPLFRRFNAFGGIPARTEGWALYAEHLAAESGWYADDPEGLLGQLDSALFRARRLVVDTGLHARGWTREQAIDYGIEPAEVERYVVIPGQATSYMVGALRIIELREKARAALGDSFSLQAFHNAVLLAGSVPLGILEREIDAHIARARAQP